MGKVMQLLLAALSTAQHHAQPDVGGRGANGASSSADLLTDLKSGYLLGANPRKQFLAQFVGIFFGTLAEVPAWFLMIPDTAALEKYPLPATQTWVAVARVLSGGVASLPLSARWAILIGGLLGLILPMLEMAFPKAKKFIPSATGLGLAFTINGFNTISFFIPDASDTPEDSVDVSTDPDAPDTAPDPDLPQDLPEPTDVPDSTEPGDAPDDPDGAEGAP